MTNPRHRLGLAAEEAVDRWLVSTGWRVLARHARRAEGGEVDLIAVDPGGVLVAVEVRARTSRRTGDAAATVDGGKIARLERTLIAEALARRMLHAGLRVDLVTAEPERDSPGLWRLRRIPGVNGV